MLGPNSSVIFLGDFRTLSGIRLLDEVDRLLDFRELKRPAALDSAATIAAIATNNRIRLLIKDLVGHAL
jgi:hypothetical protein